MTYTCIQCQQPFESEPVILLGRTLMVKTFTCSKCEDASAQRDTERQIAELYASRRRRFDDLCPPDYRPQAVVMSRLPQPAKTQAVLNWQYGARGLIASGPTQQGKTRSVWLLLSRLAVEEGRTIEAMTAGTFARSVLDTFNRSGTETRSALFERLTRCDVLFWDDFGKCKATPVVEDEMFDIVEHRKSHLRPIILTTNGTLDTLKSSFSPDRAEPLFERLISACKGVNFSVTEERKV